MEANELLKKVRQIEIKTKGLSRDIFAGEYHSAFKGRGMTFAEVREYQYGDDVRSIDWNVTARLQKPYVKVFEEEREQTVMLLVDVSRSNVFASHNQLKRDVITEIAATLAFSAIQNNDKIGIIFFSDRVEKLIPPQKGKKHILYIIRELLEFQPEGKGTDIDQALRYMTNAIKKRCTAFLLSDFLTDISYEDSAVIAKRKHDLIAIHLYDERDKEIPDVGLMKLRDAETGETKWVDTSSQKVRMMYSDYVVQKYLALQKVVAKSGMDFVSIETQQDYVKSLLQLFRSRGAKR
ncbi:MAG: DUF58 domain-containing protein [Paludibacteraceae bacterium]|nr:DUF58 domain-containing protein [Paludibacteraceae bacterium]